jgi:protein-disulfide isomerase/uncharacterized membrane protein
VALSGAAVSGLLLLQHHGDVYATAAVDQVCGEAGAANPCETVARSAYSEYNGIPLAAIGLHFYFSLALLLLSAVLFREELLDAGAFLGFAALAAALIVDVMLFGVQAFAIKAFCKLCLLTYLLNVLGLLLLLPAWRGIGTPLRALSTRSGRAALASWAVSSFTFALTVAAIDWALGLRAQQQAAAILGAPAPVPAAGSPAPATPTTSASEGTAPPPASAPATTLGAPQQADLQAELRAAREEARRLQELLDDPKKLEQYFTDKAMREFEHAAVADLSLAGTPLKGPENAPIRVVAFSDFLCPFCRSLAGAFSNYVPRSANRVAIYFKNFPLDKTCHPNLPSTVHPGACVVALGAICAQEQGRFWPYHDKVFASPPNNPQAGDVTRLAGAAGLDAAAFETCLESQKAKDRLAAEIQEGARAGVKATPTVFLNGKLLPRVNDFLAAVDKEAARLGLPPLPQPQQGN